MHLLALCDLDPDVSRAIIIDAEGRGIPPEGTDRPPRQEWFSGSWYDGIPGYFLYRCLPV
ncbi:hypothetical protein JNJ66_05155 [Candidatus Saccharibacteria bacterium]|nr:hypothetical protein [Candidatus Saccharibacteria bacterium]